MDFEKIYGGCALRIAVGITMLILMLAGGTGAATITVDDSGGADYTRIQDAVNNASVGDTIYVYSGTYTENVNVNKQVTLQGEGACVVNVSAASASDYVFEVIADYVNISGFKVTGATGNYKAGIYLGMGVDHSNISDNYASNNYFGIYVYVSTYNALTNNIANSNTEGIKMYGSGSTYSALTNNTANNNSMFGIELTDSNYNTLTSNNANNNHGHGIVLDSASKNNTLTSNTANNNSMFGIELYSSSDNNKLTSNTANNNYDGIKLYSSRNNKLTSNIANNNTNYGIMLEYSDYNMIYNNYFNNTNNAYDDRGSYPSPSNSWYTTKTACMNIIGGPYLGGNYWSDYVGVDTDGDGLGDTLTPYNLAGYTPPAGDYNPLVIVDDITAPASVTGLTNITYKQTFINWTWTDPADSDFNHVEVYLDGIQKPNVSTGVRYYNATGLTAGTAHEISTRTVDDLGNINATWENNTAKTAPGSVHNINKGTDYLTIQAAIDDAYPGDEIHVDGDTFHENLNVNKLLTIVGAGSNNTTIQADNPNTHVISISANNVNISGFTIQGATGSGYAGVYMQSVTDVMISNSTQSNNLRGIYLNNANNNNIINNNIISNLENGVVFEYSNNNKIIGNTVANTIGIGPYTGNGLNMGDRSSGGTLILNNSVYNNSCYGIVGYAGSNNMQISGNVIHSNGRCTILGWSNGGGLAVGWSSGVLVENNTAYNNSGIGVGIDTASSNTIRNNNISNNEYGIELWGLGMSGNLIYNNIISLNKEIGIVFDSGVRSHTIRNNFISKNKYGIKFSSRTDYPNYGNAIYHNNFNVNTNQASDNSSLTNYWDNGYPSGGNYWSDYIGVDSNNDGIGDAPYNISGGAGAKDMYPLIHAKVAGRVLNASSGLGIPGALVKFDDYSQYNATTNSTGDYSMSVPPGTYNITAMFEPIFYANTTIVSPDLGAIVVQDIELVKKPTGNISGSISSK